MFHAGKIITRSRISPTVMLLEIEAPSLKSFQPGQWVDFVAKPNEWVGGFSIASSPRDLPKITLAVKKSKDRPATWVHNDEQCSVGFPIEMRVGGNSVLDERLPQRPSVFCAGGIGVSPILSQYREFLFLRDKTNAASGSPDANVTVETAPTMFLYTASSTTELVFGSELAELSRHGSQLGHDKMEFALTQNKESLDSGDIPSHVTCRTGRVLAEFLNDAPHDANFYICGPPSMIDDAVNHLTNIRAIPQERIYYEKWW
mmetsp:Transcript_22174/g.54900  ORF Transcript_22174/g.54900 Transcript_22174/m.54900 type:complete len:259 (+) Transcript_22174:170-946(+)